MFRSIDETTAKPKYRKVDPQVYIFNSAGCHGHYLTYLIDRLSRKTPELKELPFNSLGNSHLKVNYSGFSQFVDSHKHTAAIGLSNQNIVKLVFTNDVLYYERAAMNRAEDSDRDINTINKDISFLKQYNLEFYNKIRELYSIKNDNVPKWMLRDAFKIGFLDWKNQGSVKRDREQIIWMNENFKNNKLHFTHVNVFFSYESLKTELEELDKKFDLDLNFEELEMLYNEFSKRNKILHSHRNTDIVLNAVRDHKDISIPNLDIIQQAYVYAQLEKLHRFIVMPLTDYFFTTTGEILDFINLYPQHYKAMNPNLPTFNNIPNPFFLHRQNKK